MIKQSPLWEYERDAYTTGAVINYKIDQEKTLTQKESSFF